SKTEVLNIRQKAGVVLFLFISAFGVFLVTSLFKPGEPSSHAVQKTGNLQWQSDLKTALKNTHPENLALIDFRADWCTACVKMEEEFFPSPEFKALVNTHHLTLVRLDYTDMDSDEKEAIVHKYNVPGFPTILILDSAGTEKYRILGFRNNADEMEKLNIVLEKKDERGQ
ncbi:MAG: thioredoxin domain-containing protein, partial [Spirochaetia bacterium]|nr:thioredoxin domain-containing protein [Spirochaetia bacterium]